MKKIGILIFIIATLVGIVFANLFSFGRVTGKIINFSFGSRVHGSGVAATEARQTAAFKGVDVGGVFQVQITAGKDCSVQVQADDNLVRYIRTEVKDGVLQIDTTERIDSSTPLRVLVSAPEIESLEVSGVSEVSLSGVSNSSLEIDASGRSKVDVDGKADEVNLEVSGASTVEAQRLKAETASVAASGASRVSVFVTESLTSSASGASTIVYSGSPASVAKDTSGSSKVYQK
jgi:hypothetical protein